MNQRLLINWADYHPSGHILEALQHAYGFHRANPDIEISLLLNADSAVLLTGGCPWLSAVYPVSLAEIGALGVDAPSLRSVPQEWDFVVHDPRVLPGAMAPGWDEEELMAAQPVIQSYLRSREWSGVSPGFTIRWNTEGLLETGGPLRFSAGANLRFNVPDEARAFANRYKHARRTIVILPVSTSGLAQSPSLEGLDYRVFGVRQDLSRSASVHHRS